MRKSVCEKSLDSQALFFSSEQNLCKFLADGCTRKKIVVG